MPTPGEPLRLLSLTQLSEATGRSRQTIRRRLAAAKLRPIRQDRRTVWYDAPSAVAVILADDLDPRAEKARLDAARANMAEFQLSALRDSVAPREEIRRAWLGIVRAARTAIRTIPERAREQIEGFTPEMARKLGELLDAATAELDDGRSGDAEPTR